MIDARAVVSPQAEIAADVEIGPFSVIGPDVVIGARTWIGPHVVINGPTRIGADNKIYQFASIGDAPQDKKYKGEPTRLEIGDRNVFRESVTVNRGTVDGKRRDPHRQRQSADGLFARGARLHPGRSDRDGELRDARRSRGARQLGDHGRTVRSASVHESWGSLFLAHNAMVTRDVPPFVMAVGRPAVPHSVNSEGLKRRGFTEGQIRNIRRAYRVLYRSGLKLQAALEQLELAAASQPEVRPFVDFIKRSSRSIVR